MAMDSSPGTVTQVLSDLNAGSPGAENRLFSLVYPELRRMAARHMYRERPDHTLQATALIHEAYLHLVDQNEPWQNRAHFFAVAAQIMRRILVDYARHHRTDRCGGRQRKVCLDDAILLSAGESDELLALDEALSRLADWDPRQSRVVELRFFGGLTEQETAHVLGVTTRTVNRDWAMAKAWLYGELRARGGT